MAREKKKEAKRRNKEAQMVEVREHGERQPDHNEKEMGAIERRLRRGYGDEWMDRHYGEDAGRNPEAEKLLRRTS